MNTNNNLNPLAQQIMSAMSSSLSVATAEQKKIEEAVKVTKDKHAAQVATINAQRKMITETMQQLNDQLVLMNSKAKEEIATNFHAELVRLGVASDDSPIQGLLDSADGALESSCKAVGKTLGFFDKAAAKVKGYVDSGRKS